MTALRPGWELGSHFDSGSVVTGGDGLSRLAALPLLESGRQALYLLSSELRQQGLHRVVLPSHHCASMIEPFVNDKWTLSWSKVSPSWSLVPPQASLDEARQTLIYSLSYFGVPESPAWLNWIREQKSRGARVLSDETHRVAGKWLNCSDYHVASLRKMLPVPDGAVLTGTNARLRRPGTQGRVRWEAMQMKHRQLRYGGPRTYLEAFERAERVTERDVKPAHASARTKSLLMNLDLRGMSTQRSQNASSLNMALTGTLARMTNSEAPIPSHAVLEHPRADALRRSLVSKRIYASVHWTQSAFAAPGEWRRNLLSVPVDHRYATHDMLRVATAIREFENEEQ